MSISAQTWNEMARGAARARVIQGRGARVGHGAMGQVVSLEMSGRWLHPWTITPRWDAVKGVWMAGVRAGLVNGRAPVMNMDAGDAPGMTLARMKEITGEAASGVVASPLYDGPAMAMEWMALGIDGSAGDEVPKFFKDRGVNAAVPVNDDTEEIEPVDAPAGNRLLRKCDVVLHQPRYGLVSDVSVGDGIVTGQATTSVTLTLTAASPGDALRVYAIAQWVSAEGEPDPLTGAYVEPTYDEIIVGTVYALSAADAAVYSDPDGGWELYVAHNLFWNLSYAQPEFVPVVTDIGEPLLVPLAGGAAQSIINEYTSLEADAMSEALEYIGEQSMQGSFWVATGGGSDSRFPMDAAVAAAGATGLHGLDKDGRLAQQREQDAAAVLAEQLDPEFPYYTPAFNINLLNQ